MLIFLYGKDTYRARQKLREIIDQYTKRYSGFQMRQFDASTGDFFDLKKEIETSSMFLEKKLIIVKNVFRNHSLAQILFENKELLQKNPSHLIVFFEEGEVDASISLLHFLKRSSLCQEFIPLKGLKLKQWIVKEFHKYGVYPIPEAVETLERVWGDDLWVLTNEIRKVAVFGKSKKKARIKQSDVEMFVEESIEIDIFATLNALAFRNKTKAVELIAKHFQKSDSPFYLISMLFFQFRKMLELKDLEGRGIAYPAILKKSSLHPYVFKRISLATQKYTLLELKTIYARIFDLELAIKTGRRDPQEALYQFALEI